MTKTTNIKSTDVVEPAEMRSLSEAELDAVVGGAMNIHIPGQRTTPTAPGALGNNGTASSSGVLTDAALGSLALLAELVATSLA
jgi:hypothetical protein